MSEWISVKDRLPLYGRYVLGIGGEVLRLPYSVRMIRSKDGPLWWFGLTQRYPTHWMPLPAPPAASSAEGSK